MTSVHTMVVELATEVWFKDSNQRVKCRARKMPLRMHSKTSFGLVSKSSWRYFFEQMTAGVMRIMVHSKR